MRVAFVWSRNRILLDGVAGDDVVDTSVEVGFSGGGVSDPPCGRQPTNETIARIAAVMTDCFMGDFSLVAWADLPEACDLFGPRSP